MATVTRQNRSTSNSRHCLFSPTVTCYLFTIKKGDTVAVDLRAEDDAVNETVE
jgi:hypothetical protein